MFDEAVASLDTAVEAAQGQLETLTGATASPEEIAEVTTPVEATATVDQETSTPAAGEGSGTGGSAGYSQAWLRGEGPGAHVHEGIQFADKSGWVGIGELLPVEGQSAQNFKVMIRAVD